MRKKAFLLLLGSDFSSGEMMHATASWASFASGFLPRHPRAWDRLISSWRGYCSLWRSPVCLESWLFRTCSLSHSLYFGHGELARHVLAVVCYGLPETGALCNSSLWARFLLVMARLGLVKMWIFWLRSPWPHLCSLWRVNLCLYSCFFAQFRSWLAVSYTMGWSKS